MARSTFEMRKVERCRDKERSRSEGDARHSNPQTALSHYRNSSWLQSVVRHCSQRKHVPTERSILQSNQPREHWLTTTTEHRHRR